MTNTIEIKAGKTQFNAKSAKNFRDTLAKWHNADFELANYILEKSDRVNALRKLVESNGADLAKIESGEATLRTRDAIEAENAQFIAKIEAENNALAEYKKAQADRYAPARELCTKELHAKYEAFIMNNDAESLDAYKLALAQFMADNGLEPCEDTLMDIIHACGKKKNSARQKCKTGNHNGALSFNTWRDIFLGEICDVMKDALPLFKFQYVLKEDRK